MGAGFTAPAVPTWSELLKAFAERAVTGGDRALFEDVSALVGEGSTGLDYEVAAQILRDRLKEGFDKAVGAVLRGGHPSRTGGDALVRARSEQLRSIPFSGILNLNFDEFLPAPLSTTRRT